MGIEGQVFEASDSLLQRENVFEYCATQHPRNPLARAACIINNTVNRGV